MLEEALMRFTGVEHLYIADSKNVPYGIKAKDDVILAKGFTDEGATLLVVLFKKVYTVDTIYDFHNR